MKEAPETILQLRQAKIERQNKNLHGGERVEGLTGRWRGIFYLRGEAMRKSRLVQPVTDIRFWRRP